VGNLQNIILFVAFAIFLNIIFIQPIKTYALKPFKFILTEISLNPFRLFFMIIK